MSVAAYRELIKRKKHLAESLPHLYGFSLYQHQQDLLNCRKEFMFNCSANQVGKSMGILLKLVTTALDQDLWKELWHKNPRSFWYFLPSQKLHNEMVLKWEDVLPKNEFQNDPYYGWEWDKRGKDTVGIVFKNGLRIFFKSYSMDVHKAMQSASVDFVAFDEEPPSEYVSEVITRTQAIRPSAKQLEIGNAFGGYKLFSFTATRSQPYFRDIFEGKGEQERFPVATMSNVWKNHTTLYDCQQFVDGTPTIYTDKKIQSIIESCPTDRDVQIRVFGRFMASDGLLFKSFNEKVNTVDKKPIISSSWNFYAGLDYGSSGHGGHESSISIVAVSPNYTQAVLYDCWVSKKETMTADGLVRKFIEMTRNIDITQAYYDWACPDIATFAQSYGLTMLKANKKQDGYITLNSLFQNKMLKIPMDVDDAVYLVKELLTLTEGQSKRNRQDDLADSLRYAISSIPWDFANPNNVVEELKELEYKGRYDRMGRKLHKQRTGYEYEDEEMDFWNEQLTIE